MSSSSSGQARLSATRRQGRKEKESFLTVAIEVARTEFHPRIDGEQGRRQCFRALGSCPRLIAQYWRPSRKMFGAATETIWKLGPNQGATSSVALPFSSLLELVRWFDDDGTKIDFAKSFRSVWIHIPKAAVRPSIHPTSGPA
jgi:hypothetical protein